MNRFFVAVGLAVVLIKGAALAQDQDATKFATAKQALEAWQKAEDEGGRRIAAKWLEDFTLSCPPPMLAESLSSLGRVMASGESRKAFLAICAKRNAPETDAAIRQTVALQLADWHTAAGESEAAFKALAAHLKSTDLPLALRLPVVSKAATILVSNLNRAADAAALYAAELAATPPEKDPSFFAEMANARAAVLHVQMRDLVNAEVETRRVIELGGACPASAYVIAVDRLVSLVAEGGRTNEVASTLLLVFRHPSLPAAGCARKLIDGGASPAQLNEAIGLLRSRVPANPAELQMRIERIQPEVVELLLALGRPDEAVRECRAFVLCAPDRIYTQAIELAARCLKFLDGDLGRANALLEFHSSAPPPSGSSNPLFDFPALDDPVRVEAARQAEKPPTDWSGWITRANLFAWLDRPVDSMDAARAAFACSPMVSNTLQSCANAVARPILVATRDPALGQRLADFLLMGAAGPDGRQGTADDIADPFPEAKRLLSYTVKASVKPTAPVTATVPVTTTTSPVTPAPPLAPVAPESPKI